MSGGLARRRKGQVGEREVAAILRARGIDAKRGWQSRGGGKEEPDVVCELPGFRLEVKRTERLELWGAYAQCERDLDPADDDTVPLVVFRRNRSKWMCCLAFEDLLDALGYASETLDTMNEVVPASANSGDRGDTPSKRRSHG